MIKILKEGKVKSVPILPVEIFIGECHACDTQFECTMSDLYAMYRAGDPTRYTLVCPLPECGDTVTIEGVDV